MFLIVAFFAKADEIAFGVEKLRCYIGVPDVVYLCRLGKASIAPALAALI